MASEERRPLLSQQRLDNLEIRFLDCNFPYHKIAETNCTITDHAQNAFEKISRNLTKLAHGNSIERRFEDCIFGIGDSKTQIENAISTMNLGTNVRFVRCTFINRELGCCEGVWRWILTNICAGVTFKPFTMQLTDSTNIVEIEQETIPFEDIPNVIRHVVEQVQEDKV